MKNGIQIFKRIEAGVIAEGAFGAKFVEMYVPFEHDFAGCRNFEIDRLAFHKLDRFLAQKSGNQIFFNIRRSGNDRAKK